ncbi:MAG TPA: MBL fold metallo-hydrolase [Flavobacterium sp.]|nr:MBL fold metallo-hydrolase [Flavobacterium sp.]
MLVRMYRAGTGDFFVLKMKSANGNFNMMIDCGCIKAGRKTFEPLLADLAVFTENTIDLLIVTHEHADHINGFQYAGDLFKDIRIKKLWLSWTEDDTDAFANKLRKENTKIKVALQNAAAKLTALKKDKYYEAFFKHDPALNAKVAKQEYFIDSVGELSALNSLPADADDKIPTMYDMLLEKKVINNTTVVEFLSPGDIRENLEGALGMRFYVLGPPRDEQALGLEEKAGEGYHRREQKSTVDFSFINALVNDVDAADFSPFDPAYNCAQPENKAAYEDPDNQWRSIDHDWLYSSGSLALRFQKSINNTSLVLAIQFLDSEKVLLFPADAEYGNWESWQAVKFKTTIKGEIKTVGAEYLLNNTVFYKVGHHLSQNGSSKTHGIEMMLQDDMAAMATLDFKKINSGWLNTMPNDEIGAELLKRTKGKIFFVGDYEKILKNIATGRVQIKAQDLQTAKDLNRPFTGKFYIDYEVDGLL